MKKIEVTVPLMGGYDANYAFGKILEWCSVYIYGKVDVTQKEVSMYGTWQRNDRPDVSVVFTITGDWEYIDHDNEYKIEEV